MANDRRIEENERAHKDLAAAKAREVEASGGDAARGRDLQQALDNIDRAADDASGAPTETAEIGGETVERRSAVDVFEGSLTPSGDVDAIDQETDNQQKDTPA